MSPATATTPWHLTDAAIRKEAATTTSEKGFYQEMHGDLIHLLEHRE
jgi:hypothetical protein